MQGLASLCHSSLTLPGMHSNGPNRKPHMALLEILKAAAEEAYVNGSVSCQMTQEANSKLLLVLACRMAMWME